MSESFRDFAQRLHVEAVRQVIKAKSEGALDGLVTIAVAEALSRAAAMALETAKR